MTPCDTCPCGLRGPRPARLGGQISYWMEGNPDAYRQVLLPANIPKLLDQGLITGGGQAGLFGPLGERAGPETGGRVIIKGVARIGRNSHRDT